MQARIMQTRYFVWILIGLCFLYLSFELFFNQFAILSVDEFWFAHRIYQFKDGLPYRDFSPYKTTLGYYLLLLPMLISKGIIPTLIFTKHVIAIINAGVLFFSAWWMRRFFSYSAILTSLAFLLCSDIMLTYSTNNRIDLLAYWFCLLSFLMLLNNRYAWTGFFLGLGFITSQKVVWYIFASNVALCMYALVYARHIKTIKNIFLCNAIIALVIFLYIALWSSLTNMTTVLHNIFYEAYLMYQLDWYQSTRKFFWQITLLYNPLLFLLWPLTLMSLMITYEKDCYAMRLLILSYAFAILFCLIPYKQIFPYYMQVTLPVFLVMYSAFFSWLFDLKTQKSLQLLIHFYVIWLFIIFYLCFIASLYYFFNLPEVYLLIAIIPLYLGYEITRYRILSPCCFNIIMITMIFIGGIYPLTLFASRLLFENGSYQKANIEVINALLKDGNDYVAGIELIYNKTQPIAGMRHLGGPSIDYLYSQSKKIRPTLLASLYADPTVTIDSVIASLKKSSVKFYVNNYRMNALPNQIKTYLQNNYAHFYGSIYLYAPTIPAGQHEIKLKFSGDYLIESHSNVIMNKKIYRSGMIYHLNRGSIESDASKPYRLKYKPTKISNLDKAYLQDEWAKLLY